MSFIQNFLQYIQSAVLKFGLNLQFDTVDTIVIIKQKADTILTYFRRV